MENGSLTPRAIRPLAGRAHSGGFSLSLEVDRETYQAEIGLKGVQVEKADPPEGGILGDIPWGFGVPPRLQLPVALLLTLTFLGLLAYEFFDYERDFILVLPLLMVSLGVLLRLDGTGRWHSLEHKSIWVLKDNPPRDLEALQDALRRASPYHPCCRSIFGTLTLQELNLPRPLVVALQWPFLAPPKEEELEIAARGLAELLSTLDGMPHEDKPLEAKEEALKEE